MGRMRDLHITIHNGGDQAVAAVERIGKDWREQLEQAASEVEQLRLTDAEREAIRHFGEARRAFACPYAATLRGLLERTK
jgi:hypothetical protein